MSLGDYRWFVLNQPVVAGNGDLHFDLRVELCTSLDPETWELIEQGHYTLVVPGSVIIIINNGTGTTAQKRQLVKDWITDAVQLRGVSVADQARRALLALLPGGVWPANGVNESWTPSA